MKTREQSFCYHFHRLRNGKEAAIRAGFLPLFADGAAMKLLQREDIRMAVQALDQKREHKELEQAVIAGLSRLAFGEANDSVKLAFYESETLIAKLDELDLFSVSEIKRPKENALEIKFFDRFKAMEKLLELAEKADSGEMLNGFYHALEQSASRTEEVADVPV